MRQYAGILRFLAGVAVLLAGLGYGVEAALGAAFNLYYQYHPCGCGTRSFSPLIMGTFAVVDFITHRYWIAYPVTAATLFPLWLRRERRYSARKPLAISEPKIGVWPPAPKT